MLMIRNIFSHNRKVISFTAILAAAVAISPVPGWAQNAPRVTERADEATNIIVSGTGEVRMAPDIARLTLGVQTQGQDSTRAAAENAQRTAQVVSAIKAVGVTDPDIQTASYSISPEYAPIPPVARPGDESRPPRIVAFRVDNSLQITVRKIADVGKAIDAAVKAGANVAGGIQFDVADRTRAEAEALRRAVTDAERKARVIAEAAGRPQIVLLEIAESGLGSPRPVFDASFRGLAAQEAVSTPVQPGELTRTVRVTARYRFARDGDRLR